jgi:hypothetical protein
MLHVESLDYPGRLPGFFALWVLGSEAELFRGAGSGLLEGKSLVSIDPVFRALFLVCNGQHENNVVLNTVHESLGES